MSKLVTTALLTALLTSCSLAPKYQRPEMPLPAHFKEAANWVPARTQTHTATRTPWWQAFNQPVLNQLHIKLEQANQDLSSSWFRYQQAQALVQVAAAGLFPSARAISNVSRQQTSLNVANPSTPALYNNVLAGSVLNYEIDLWGRIRNTVAEHRSLATASHADRAALSLSLHAELANNYFALRGCDESQRILDRTVAAYDKAMHLTQKRYHGGASPVEDVDNAKTLLENAKTQAAEMRLKRGQIEHTIAVLIGENPATFKLASASLPRTTLRVSPILASTLLERRPDIAAAESRVKAANASIGVARAAFFPNINLTSVVGFQSQSVANLISKPSLFWSLGPLSALNVIQPMLGQTVFDGGRLNGLLTGAKAGYFETVAEYRQTVLRAFQQVEDSLIAIGELDKQIQSQSAAAQAAKRALLQAQNRYKGGIATYLDIVITENNALHAELATVNVITRRQLASIQLIKALGGDWVIENTQ